MTDRTINTQDRLIVELSDRCVVEAAVEAWLESKDSRRWDCSDFRNSDDCENARFHFEGWFENFIVESPDPYDLHEDGFDEEVWNRIDDLGTVFFEEVYNTIFNL